VHFTHILTLGMELYLEVQNCAHLGYFKASSDNFSPTFRDNLSVPPDPKRWER